MITPRRWWAKGGFVEWSHVVVGLVASVFGGGTVATLTSTLARRRLARVEAADALAESAIELLQTMKADSRADLTAMRADVAEARREAAEARREAAELRLTIRAVTREAEELAGYLQRVTAAIHDPTMTMERLRVLVGSGPPNGSLRLRTAD